MRKTNSTPYINDIREMILDNIETEGLEKYFNEEKYNIIPLRTKMKLKYVLDRFNSEYNYKNNKLRYPNLELRFSEWLMGLPSVIYVPFNYFDIIETNKKLHNVKEFTKEQENRLIERNFHHWATHILRYARDMKIDLGYLNN